MKTFRNGENVTLGVFQVGKGKSKALQVNYVTDKENSGIILYDKQTNNELGRFSFEENASDNLRKLTIPQYSIDKITYMFYEEGKPVIDKYSLAFAGTDSFGTVKSIDKYRSILPTKKYNWEDDFCPGLSMRESVLYCMHVRGFTMHESSNIKAKGTFAGIIEKLPYLKSLGITTLELQPAYEFPEYPISYTETVASDTSPRGKINYWGYTEGFYYTPKRAYSSGPDPVIEFKDLVKVLHQNRMELIMQFYFPDTFPVTEIVPILRFWHREYHVDGFHLKGNALPVTSMATDPDLYHVKLLHESFDDKKLVHISGKQRANLVLYNNDYLYSLRSFLKSDFNTLLPAMRKMFETNIPKKLSVMNYMSNYHGFTMNDMVSYQEKHNEENGEENRDGTDYNLTWNCGAEGICHKIEIQVIRERQLRNALALLFLSQGTPLIFMGDEFCNTQYGNNNPYCQDNEITWLDWENLKRHEGLHAYVKQLIYLRKNNHAFSMTEEMLKTQTNGLPGISYHGSEAWKLSLDENTLHMGILLNGHDFQNDEGRYWYIAINMHWEEQYLALPNVKSEAPWECVLSTEGSIKQWEDKHQILLGPRSISLFCIRE